MILTLDKLGFVLIQTTLPAVDNKGEIWYDLLVNIGSIAAILAIIVIIYKIGVFIQKHVGKIEHLENDASSNVKPAIEKIDNKIETRLVPAITEINSGVAYLRGAWERSVIRNVTESNSPMVLNEKGRKILVDSGIDKIVDSQFEDILAKVREKNPVNAYQAQETIKDIVKELIYNPLLKNQIELGAFRAGSDVEIVLFTGAFYIRDRILEKMNLVPEDIDKDDPSVQT
jgi:hypothetical protein